MPFQVARKFILLTLPRHIFFGCRGLDQVSWSSMQQQKYLWGREPSTVYMVTCYPEASLRHPESLNMSCRFSQAQESIFCSRNVALFTWVCRLEIHKNQKRMLSSRMFSEGFSSAKLGTRSSSNMLSESVPEWRNLLGRKGADVRADRPSCKDKNTPKHNKITAQQKSYIEIYIYVHTHTNTNIHRRTEWKWISLCVHECLLFNHIFF